MTQPDFDDVSADPHKYGAPTFEEFKRSRSKYIADPRDWFHWVANGSTNKETKYVVKYHHFMGTTFQNLDEMDSFCTRNGFSVSSLKAVPKQILGENGKYRYDVYWMTGEEYERRRKWS